MLHFTLSSLPQHQYILIKLRVMKSACILICFTCLIIVNKANAFQRDTVYKFGDFLIEASDTTKIDFIIKKAPDRKRVSKGDTIYENEKYLILGDDDKTLVQGVFRKYKLRHKFSQFPVDVYKGKLAAPNFNTDTEAYSFRTQIRNQCKDKGINFAGHYTIAKWGCGSDCQTVAIVDRLDGKIYYSNLSKINNDIAYGLKCRPNSRMLILNSGLLERHKGYVSCSKIVNVEIIEWVHNKARRLPE
jgi:hypothetical protein